MIIFFFKKSSLKKKIYTIHIHLYTDSILVHIENKHLKKILLWRLL